MIANISGVTYARQSTNLASAKGSADFAAIPSSSEKTSSTASSVEIQISDAAQSKQSPEHFDFDFSFNNVNHTQEEYHAYVAEGPRRVSAMQGLPEGQYDFANISPAQAQVVQSNAIMNGADSNDLIGIGSFVSENLTWSGGRPVYSDVPGNAYDLTMNLQVSRAGYNNEAFGVPTFALAWMMDRQGAALSTDLQNSIVGLLTKASNHQ